VEQAIADRSAELRAVTDAGRRSGRMIQGVAAAAALAVLVAVAGGVVLQRQARAAVTRAAEAQQQAQAAVAAASRELTTVREDAARQVAEARDGAARAQVVGDVLASPDLIRFNIAGSGTAPIAGQVLWSRSRGVVFSGVRLPAPPPRMTYQLWLLTDGVPVNAGTFTPDPSGRVTFTGDAPRIPRAVTGAALTLEPAGGSQVPSDRLLGQNRVVRPTQ
jgi:anti-sigma-K factor RskA